jgi:hypothetical protein
MIIDDYWFLEGFIAKIWPVFWCGQKSPWFSHLSLVSSFLAHRSDIFTYLFWPYAFEFSAAHVFISLAVTAFSERSDGFTCAKTLGRGHSKVSTDTEIEWEIVWNCHKYPLKLTVDICWYLLRLGRFVHLSRFLRCLGHPACRNRKRCLSKPYKFSEKNRLRATDQYVFSLDSLDFTDLNRSLTKPLKAMPFPPRLATPGFMTSPEKFSALSRVGMISSKVASKCHLKNIVQISYHIHIINL